MNRYIQAIGNLTVGITKVVLTKIFHLKSFRASVFSFMSSSSELTLNYGGKLKLGKKIKLRDNSKLRVRKNAVCEIGKNTSINSGNIIVCREKIIIGESVQFAPNVLIYDHDHDYKAEGGVSAMKYKTSPVIIGDNCWIGANTVILRGTTLGKNCVVGAGCIIKGNYPDNSVIIQKRETIVKINEEQ